MRQEKEFDSITPRVTVYSSRGTIYLIPLAQCRRRKHPAETVAMSPMLSVKADAPAEEIGSVALQALERCVLLDDAPPDEQRFDGKAWRRELGFKTYTDFLRESTYITLIREPKVYEIIPSKRSHDAFQWQRKNMLQAPLTTSPGFFGKQIVKALELSDKVNPLLPKFHNPNPGQYPDTLSPQAIEQIQRLGGTMPDAPPTGTQVLLNVTVPKALEMFSNVQWPDKEFCGNRYDTLRMVEFGYWGEVEELDQMRVVGIEDRALAHIAFTDGGNTYLVFDLHDPNPSDPMVYELDHDWPGQSLSLNVPLSKLLSDLEEETGGDDEE